MVVLFVFVTVLLLVVAVVIVGRQSPQRWMRRSYLVPLILTTFCRFFSPSTKVPSSQKRDGTTDHLLLSFGGNSASSSPNEAGATSKATYSDNGVLNPSFSADDCVSSSVDAFADVLSPSSYAR